MEGKNDGMAIGVDLGTTYSCAAVWKYDRIEIIPNDLGNRITPSCVAFTEELRLIGDAAINQASANSINTIFDALGTLDNAPRNANTGTSYEIFPHSDPEDSEPKHREKPSFSRKFGIAALHFAGFFLKFAGIDLSFVLDRFK